MSFFDKLNKDNIPTHIAMIMDGNGRWAKEQGKNRIFGHQHGVDTVRRMVECCPKLGVKYLTLYAFSTENWNRPRLEINALMELLVSTIRKEIKKLHENNVRVHSIGQLEDLLQKCQRELSEASKMTQNNTGLNLVLALSYSARWDVVNAVNRISQDVANGVAQPGNMNYDDVRSYLSTSKFPDPELLIRTSGEQRISNYLLLELAYAELYFTNVHWPAFKEEDLYEAVYNYQQRERRYGKTSEQIVQ